MPRSARPRSTTAAHARLLAFASAFVVAMLCLCAQTLFAQTQYFRIGGGGAWNSTGNWSLSSGGPSAGAFPGAGDIAVFDNLSGSPVITLTAPITVGQLVVQGGGIVRFNAAAAQTLTIAGLAASTVSPLFVNALSELRVMNNVTLLVNGPSAAANGASIFGKIVSEIGATINNSSTRPFSVESGGTLEMAGGTYLNGAGTIIYALTGTRGTLSYTRPDNTSVTIPALGVNEMPPVGVPLGNVYIKRGIPNAFTSFTDGPAGGAPQYILRGTLTVDASVFTLGDQGMTRAVNVVMAASKMLNGGLIQGNAFSVLDYQDDPVNPLNPATSDLTFLTSPLNTLQNDGAGLFGLLNRIRTLNLALNSDVNIYGTVAMNGGLQIVSVSAPLAGKITNAATRTLSLRNNSTSQIQGDNNGQLIINGILSVSTNATLSNLNNSGGVTGSNPLAGVIVNAGGRIRVWGGNVTAGNTDVVGITSTVGGRTYYTGSTAVLEYTDQGDGATTSGVIAGVSQTVKTANRAELPEQMLGTLVINRTSQMAKDNTSAMAPTMGDGYYVLLPTTPAPTSTRLLGPLNLQQGVLGMNGSLLYVDGTVTRSNGGFIAGNDIVGMNNTDALVFRSGSAATMPVTGATITTITSGSNFNFVEVGGAGSLTIGGRMNIDGDAGVTAYGLAGVSNYNGQLRFTGAGNLILNSTDLSFSGVNSANLTPGAQGGHIPVTTGSVGAIFGDSGANITFNSTGTPAARSFPRFASGGQIVNNYTVGNGAGTYTMDYLVSQRSPLVVNGILLLRSNSVLQLGPSGDLTYKNANIQFANPAAPQFYGNIIDASQGGRLTVTSVPNASFTVPVGVGFTQLPPYTNGIVTMTRLVTIDNTAGANGDTYTVTTTSAIVNLVSAVPSLVNQSMRGQWNITRNGGAPLVGNITLNWTPDVFVPAPGDLSGSEPNLASQFQPRMIANPPLTTMRRWNGSSYVNVLPVTTPLPGVVTAAAPALRSITAIHSGTLNSTPFIITNALFPTYWVGGPNTDWGTGTNWASTSGGTPGSASVPGIGDYAVFDRGVTTTVRTNFPRVGAAQPANGLQKLRIEGNSNVTFAPTDFPTVMEIAQNDLDDNLYVERGSTLAVGENTGSPLLQPMTVRIPDVSTGPPAIMLTNAPSVGIFGTLTLQQLGTFEYLNAQANNICLIANGATLNMAGGTFTKGATSLLQYGQNQFTTRGTVAPFYGISTTLAYANAALAYTAPGGGPQTITPGTTNELPTTPLNARLLVNRPAAGATVRINAATYQISSSVTVQAGILDMNAQTFQVGFGTYPATGNVPNLDRSLTVASPNGFLRGNATTVLALNGMGQSNLRFEPATTINTMVINDLSTSATLSGVGASLATDLVTGDLQVVAGKRVVTPPSYGWNYALAINPGITLRLNNAAASNSFGAAAGQTGRVLAGGTLQVVGGALVRLPDAFNQGGLDVSTTGTLHILDGTAGAVDTQTASAGPPALPTNIVRYLAPASRLLLTNNPATGGGLKGLNAVEFPYVFNASMVVDKTGPTPVNNMVQPNYCRAFTTGTLTVVNGFYDINNFSLRIGGAINGTNAASAALPPYIYNYPDVLNIVSGTAAISISAATGGLIPFNTTPIGNNQAAIIYNSNVSATLNLKQQAGANMMFTDPVDPLQMYPAISLNKLENRGTGTLTLGSNLVVRIDGTNNVSACETGFGNPGQLRLVDNTGNVALTGTRLVFTGAAANPGYLNTSSTNGSIVGDALATTALRFASTLPFPLQHNLKVGTGVGSQFNNIQVEPATAPLNPNTYVQMHNSATTQDFLLRRGIVAITNATINLTITSTTTGNVTVGQASFGFPNQNYFNTTGGGLLTLTIPAGGQRMFPVAALNNVGALGLSGASIQLAPVAITNGSAVNETYSISADTVIKNQKLVYTSRVNVQWTITKTSGTATNQFVDFAWNTEHETNAGSDPGFNRSQSSPAQWNGSAYTFLTNQISDLLFPGTAPPAINQGGMWRQSVVLPTATFNAAQPWAVLAPPVASILAVDPTNVTGVADFNGGSLTVQSGVPFNVRFTSFNGFGTPTPPITAVNLTASISATPPAGADAILNLGAASLGLASTIPANSLSSAPVSTFTIDWVNPGNRTSTTAVLNVLVAGSLTWTPLTFTVLAPTIQPARISFADIDNASTATIGFNRRPGTSYGLTVAGTTFALPANNGTLALPPTGGVPPAAGTGFTALLTGTPAQNNGQFNVTGGVAIPMYFGLFGPDNLLRPTSAALDVDRTYMVTISNPPNGSAIFSTTNSLSNPVPGYAGVALPPTITTSATFSVNGNKTSALLPIFNWVGYDQRATPNGPASRGLSLNGPPVPTLNPITAAIKQPVGVTTAVITLSSYKTYNSYNYFGGGVSTAVATPYFDVISTSVIVHISTGATVPTQIAMTPVSGALNPEFMNVYAAAPFSLPQSSIVDSAGLAGFNTNPDGITANTGFNATVGPITSGSRVPIYIGTFGSNGAIIPPPPGTRVRVTLTAINPGDALQADVQTDVDVSPVTGTAFINPRFLSLAAPPAGNTVSGLVTISQIAGSVVLSSTTVTIQISSTSNVPAQLGFYRNAWITVANASSQPLWDSAGSAGILTSPGITRPTATSLAIIEAGRPFSFDFGVFTSSPGRTPAFGGFGGVQLTIAPDPSNPTETFTLSGSQGTGVLVQSGGQISGAVINWLTPGATPRLAQLTLTGTGSFAGIISTTITVMVTPQNVVPARLAFSTISGFQADALPIQVLASSIFNTTVGLFNSFGAPVTSLTNIGVVLSVTSADGNSYSIDPAATQNGVLVNLQNILIPTRILWNNATASLSGRVTIIATPSDPTIAATQATITITSTGTLPGIQDFTPKFGVVGTTVSIVGTNFTGVNSVNIGNVPAQIINVTPGSILAVVGAGATTGPVTVSRPSGPWGPGGSATSAPVAFTIGVPPGVSLTGFTPSSGGTGTQVIITGTGLSNAQNVTVAGLATTIISNSNTQIVAQIIGSSAVTLAGPVQILLSNGVVRSSTNFNYILSPSITSVTPNSFIANGTTVGLVIIGQNFSNNGGGQEAVLVDNGGGTVALPAVSGVTNRTPTRIDMIYPAQFNLAPGTRRIIVRNSDNQTASVNITLLPAPAPSVRSVVPSVTTATGYAFPVTIAGSNFFGAAGLSITLSNGSQTITVNSFAVSSNRDSVSFVIPSNFNNQAATLNITLRNADGQSASAQVRVNDAAAPVITRVTPNPVVVGSPGQAMVVEGTGFFANAIFTVGTTVVVPAALSPTRAVLNLASSFFATLGNVPIVVRNLDGKQALGGFAVVRPLPQITTITPSTSASQFGFVMTINGVNFRTASVTFAPVGMSLTQRVSLPVLQQNQSVILAQVAASLNLQGSYIVTVTNGDDMSSTSATYTIGSSTTPVITGSQTSPSTVRADGSAFDLILTGRNFSQNPPPTVTFNGTNLQITSVSGTEIRVLVPPGVYNVDPSTIVVTNPNGETARATFLRGVVGIRVPNPIEGALFPNPVTEVFTVEAAIKQPSQVVMRLTDALGRTMFEVRELVPAGTLRKQFDASNLPVGMYLFEMYDGERRFIEKVIKQ
jgi:hypothetical protein